MCAFVAFYIYPTLRLFSLSLYSHQPFRTNKFPFSVSIFICTFTLLINVDTIQASITITYIALVLYYSTVLSNYEKARWL